MVEKIKTAYMKMLQNYFNFSDRTSRSDFWYAVLANAIIGFAIGFVSGITGIKAIGALSSLYSLAVLIPGIAIVIRRLHDINKSGWWYFISLVPLVGVIWLIILLCSPSVNENNNYGTQL